MSCVTIAVDAMGGDHGPSVIVPASLQALQNYSDLQIVLVGDQAILQQELKQHSTYVGSRLTIYHAAEQVGMDESPTQALRYKKDSSMRVALNLVKEHQVQACVSAGNTGALMAIAHFVLKTIEGVDRPAIISLLPAYGKNMRMLDLGANVDSSAINLVQFAVMASVFAAVVDNIANPSVYLLNIGEEIIKGNKQVKETAQLLAATQGINYKGYIEGDGLYKGEADIIVCDGFVGNVALKTSEGAANFMIQLIKEGFRRNPLTYLAGLIALPVLKDIHKKVDPSLYNGATFLGLRGIVVKSHGHANVRGFERAIREAMIQAQKNILHLISDEIEKLLKLTRLGTS